MNRSARLFSVCLLALFSALPTFAKDKDKVQTIKFDFNGKQRTYLVLIPNSAAPTAPLPVVMLIHAQGDYDSGPMGAWKGFASQQGFIAVSPESTSNTMWDSRNDGPDYLHAVLVDVAKKHPIDPTKVFMFGDDSGGIYAMAVGLYDAQDWGAVCAEHAIVPTDDYKLFPHAPRKIAFQDWVGSEDQDHPLRVMALEHDAFTQAGFPFDLKIIPNSPGSYGGGVIDQVNQGCYNFFLKNPLPAPGAPYLASPAAAPAAAPASQ
jgi:poly(3-hydroxybutyrate) depolymerase